MTNLIVLDVAIGLIFVFLLYGLLATVIQEMLATLFDFRAKVLERAICRMLQDKPLYTSRSKGLRGLFRRKEKEPSGNAFLNQFYHHPIVRFLGEDETKKPSYLSKEIFSKVLIDLLLGIETEPGKEVRNKITLALSTQKDDFINEKTKAQLLMYWNDANQEIEKFRASIEQWFDDTQVRCTGWYKKNTQYLLLGIGLIIAIAFNVDTISIAGKLQKDKDLRKLVVEQAEAYMNAHPDPYGELTTALSRYEKDSIALVSASEAPVLDSISQAKLASDKQDIAAADSMLKRFHRSIQLSDSLINEDISKMNGLIGLGWSRVKENHQPFVVKSVDPIPFGRALCQFGLGLWSWFLTFIGWLITALAISLGAPFWFDTLSKVMQLKGSIGGKTKKVENGV
jgi:hypothetical protein